MYLTRLTLNTDCPQARRDLSSPYELHRTLARVYAPDANSHPARFLWRREADRDGLPAATVLVQAAAPGHWRCVIDLPDYVTDLQADKPLDLARLTQTGQTCRFRLLANPTVTREGKRHGLKDDDSRMAWLHRQGQRHGFQVLTAQQLAHTRLVTRQDNPGRRISLDSAWFEGHLQCTDENALAAALVQGIGPGKALGLGMLSLAPLRPSAVS
jgi:CRISPR system Cascade subunit CasE